MKPGRPTRFATLTVIAASMGIVCASASPSIAGIFGPPVTPAPHAATIVGRMGLEMSESDARHALMFRPFTPPRRIVVVAVLPPFHGDDVRANRGIGFEYFDEKNRRYALAEWPSNGGSIERFVRLSEPEPACAAARMFRRGTKPNGIVWSTPHGLIMTLQADGANDARTLGIEWRKLIRRGACR